jgi:hypothetical protein
MHRNATKIIFTHHLTLTSVNASANLNPELLDLVRDRPAATNGARRAIESRQKAVARRVDFPTTVLPKLLTNEQVMLGQKAFPCSVAKFDYSRGRANDICEKYGREHAVKFGFNFSALAGQKRFGLTQD